MAYFKTSNFILDYRQRVGLTRYEVEKNAPLGGKTLKRIETGTQSPMKFTLDSIMKSIGALDDGFIYPLLENQHPSVLVKRDKVVHMLDLEELASAEVLLGEIESIPEFMDNDINRQFVLSQKARLNEIRGEPPEGILLVLGEALALTFPDFDENTLRRSILVYEEAEILHTMSLTKARMGDREDAIRLLDALQTCLSRLDAEGRVKERKLGPVLLSLAGLCIEAGHYEYAREVINTGVLFSATRMSGKLCPHFTFEKAKALKGLGGDEADIERLLNVAYFNFLMVGNKSFANKVRDIAADEFRVVIKTYGADKFVNGKKMPYDRSIPISDAVECRRPGELIDLLQKRLGISLTDLAEGLCANSTLTRVINGEIDQINIEIFETILQRFGVNCDLYHIFLLSDTEFMEREMRDKIMVELGFGNHEKARRLIDALLEHPKLGKQYKTNKDDKKKSKPQFIMMAQASIANLKGKAGKVEYKELLLNAIRMTCPKFNESDCGSHLMAYTRTEIILIHQLAIHYGENEEYNKAIALYEGLIHNKDRMFHDEKEKSRMYATIMYAYSKYLGKANRRSQAVAAAEKGIMFAQSHDELITLPDLAYNMGYSQYELGRIEESLAWFVMSYYGSVMFADFGEAVHLPHISSTIKDKFGICVQ